MTVREMGRMGGIFRGAQRRTEGGSLDESRKTAGKMGGMARWGRQFQSERSGGRGGKGDMTVEELAHIGGEASGRARRERASHGGLGNELWALQNTPGGPEEESDLEGSITTRNEGRKSGFARGGGDPNILVSKIGFSGRAAGHRGVNRSFDEIDNAGLDGGDDDESGSYRRDSGSKRARNF